MADDGDGDDDDDWGATVDGAEEDEPAGTASPSLSPSSSPATPAGEGEAVGGEDLW